MAQAWETEFGAEGGLFRSLRSACAADWAAYTWHPFVRGLSDGTLPLPAFRRYLIQDYLFLIHFARAKALAVFKAESVEAMRDKAEAIRAILAETTMHLRYCEGWGIAEAEVRATPESAETVSYTRYVIDRGLAGDILDLEVALAPCTVGYGEVALRILADPNRRTEGNPYQSWIDTYADPGYQAIAKAAAARIDALGESHGGQARFAILGSTFAEAARLEARFWQQGLDAAEGHMASYETARR
ncbi:thiaminase II [Paracraurococcus ruber]|uniref:Aminopyrimidine aminohydrolase n=1 Tax=Paracraurococcus ruber TaxID=77675 RepID=A0ABS1CRP7_9PROT|nr:thiaminase II [Paracraurococcus ruber]MBK1656956.1 thiaminase II [Paracraurococcus ruber]TDG34249.1 thiaminase II [Paracraurococcus ruber]